MRATIHPNGPRPAVRAMNGVRNDLTCIGIVDLSNADIPRLPPHCVGDRVRNALPLMSRKNCFVPTLRFESGSFIDGESCVVADLDALAVVDIFVSDIAPFARQINLG